MTPVLLALGLALPVAAAYCAIGRTLRAPADLADRALRIGLAVPLGLGAASLLSYAWLVSGGALGRVYALADLALFGAALAALRPWIPRGERRAGATALATPERVAVALVALALGVAAVSFAQRSLVKPFGEWDAWTIWSGHARFLYRGGAGWRVMLDPQLAYSHNEYPLLLPTVIARLWAYSGETAAGPALVAFAFTISTALVVHGAVSRQAGHVAGAVATLFLLATDSWRSWGPAQYADVPLACLVAAAAACATSRDAPRPAGVLALAGAFLGLAAWTKEEGVVLGALFGAWALLGRGEPIRRRAGALLAGAALPLAVRAHFQVALAPTFAGDFAGQTAGGSVARLLSPERWAVIARELPPNLPGAETWLPLVVAVGAIALGARWRELPRSAAAPALLAWCALACVYAITPIDLEWHIDRSAARVLLQPGPALLVGLFGVVRRAGDPGERPVPLEDGGPGAGG